MIYILENKKKGAMAPFFMDKTLTIKIMSYFSSFKIRSFFAFALAALSCFGAAAAGHAQSAPQARQTVGPLAAAED